MKVPLVKLLNQRGIGYLEIPGEIAGYDAIVQDVLLLIAGNKGE